jgi:hypothetical protein
MNNGDDLQMVRTIFDALPSIIFVVDEDVRIQEYNKAAAEFLKANRSSILKRRGGDVFHCIHTTDGSGECGHGPLCKDCIIRGSVAEAFDGNRIVRRRAKIEIIRKGEKIEIYALVTATPFHYADSALVLLVIEDISEVAELKKMIPICSVCKKIRNDKASWSRIESYFKENWHVDFSHGLCPECYQAEIEKIKADIKNVQDAADENR